LINECAEGQGVELGKEIFDDPQLDAAPLTGRAKMLAWLSLACWFGAILTGRLLAYTSTSR
jgi:hypothetical protein